jgi:carboxyl-terminal processing protease
MAYRKKLTAHIRTLACGLVAALFVIPQLTLAGEAGTRVAIRPGAGDAFRHTNDPTAYPSYNPATQPGQNFPANGFTPLPGNDRPTPHSYIPDTQPGLVLPPTDSPSAPWNGQPVYDESPYNHLPAAPAPSHREPTIDEELTHRYTDPRMVRAMQSTSMSQLTSLYMETSQLIDQRHINPISYEERTRRALATLARAIENPAFLKAARVAGNPASVRQAQAELGGLERRQPARSAQEALSVMQYAASVLNRSLGIPMEATALEFINGTIDALDTYSAYVPVETAQGPSAGLEEHIVGIGVELKAHDSGLQIVGVVDGGPAAAAKLQRGDVIVSINNRAIQGLSLNEGADLITGPAGTTVHLTVIRDGRTGTVTLPRRSVYVSSVTGVQMIDPQQKVGYIRLKQFSESSSQDLDKALWKLYQEGMQTLVFDLRGNPGGLLTAAIAISDKFVANGPIVSTKGRHAEDNSQEMASFDRTWKIPLVVLIDEDSASASEIFAAAIQDNGRGVIVGRRSYGKGTVQTHFPLRSVGGDFKLTTAKFYSPSGREMAGAGVLPDVQVPAHNAGLELPFDQDADIIAAIRITADGRPADLASRAGNTRTRPQGTSQFSI